MVRWLKDAISRNLRKPEATFFGMLIKHGLIRKNGYLEQNAVKLCNIQPNDKVLEVGFGPGVGLKAAAKYVEGGKGTIYGADFSPQMVKVATKRLRDQIQNGRVILCEANVENLPYQAKTFDKVFHVNCYYFWPDITSASCELFRVMKPRSMMVTVFNPAALKYVNQKGIMMYGNTDPSRYLEGLESVGFENVTVEDHRHRDIVFKAVFAHVGPQK